ncbi:hypothetical protein D9M71_164780 [compost metagenome]
MAAITECKSPIGGRHQAAGALEQDYGIELLRQRKHSARSVGLDFVSGNSQQTRGLAWMRRDHAARRQADLPVRQQVERIGIPDLERLQPRDNAEQAAPPGVLPQSRPGHQYIGPVRQGQQLVGRAHAGAHYFRAPRQRGHHMLGPGRQRHQPGPASQRTLRREQRRTAQPAVAAHHQQVPELPLVCSARTWRQAHETARRHTLGDARRQRDQGGIGLQIVEYQLTHLVRCIGGEQAQLETDEGHRQVRTHRNAKDAAGVGAEAGGDVHGQHRQSTGVDQADRLGVGLAHLAGQPGAQQGIHHYAFQGSAFAPRLDTHTRGSGFIPRQRRVAGQRIGSAHRQHLHLPAGTLGQGRDKVAIAGIVAPPGQHAEASGFRPTPAQGAPGRVGGTLHQLEAGRAGGNEARIEVPHLGGGMERNGQVVAGGRHGIRLQLRGLAELYPPRHRFPAPA